MGFVNHAISATLNTTFELSDPNNSVGSALVKGAFWTAFDAVAPGGPTLRMIAGAGKFTAEQLMDHKYTGKSKIQKYYNAGFGGNYLDTHNAATMRQRGVQAMQASKLNARSVLGSEARSFHTNF